MSTGAKPAERPERCVIDWKRRVMVIAERLVAFTVLTAAILLYTAIRARLGAVASSGVLDLAAIALAVVAAFRLAEGRFRFDVLGMRLRGASATLMLWLLCFVVLLVVGRP